MVECLYVKLEQRTARQERWATFVFCMRRTLGDNVSATKEVENSISRLETSPSRDSDCLLNGSVVYTR